ncbi:probable E3 ubiquitin-protein ligase HERC4 [Centruroides sculpturatus]|uniref:probable E3 ubiquitin-protein ligase HERC4 n=1 Tax=Centruroides sculpturatus TaxID=218467 RepID=UPI000C6DA06F|nr:probable E3 ubiquitin-protein ligase HERC4 [Centruroides sculpturatus]XP_023212761.1 probable E3 ubiquitin-protein ligase HERC4 [Centruroides sculpturatus]
MSTAVFCWGNTSNGELGLGGIEESYIDSPRRWKNFLMESNVSDISCGKNHTLVLLNDGTVYSCGRNDMGQLGHNESQLRLEQIKALQVHHIQRISCGNNHSLALNEAGQVFSWGSNNYGQLGLATEEESISSPKMIKRLAMFTVIQISCGAHHSLALTSVGELYSWGYNNYGQLGIGNNNNQNIPCLIVSLIGIPIKHIASGGNHNCILTKSGGLFSWGKNTFGQLGLNDDQDRVFPVNQKSLRSHHIKYISCGDDHTACLTRDGGVFTFGAGMYGQLGHGSKSNEILPRKVLELMGSVVTQVSCGRCHTMTYVPNGNRIFVFGLNGSGQLGVGNSLTNHTLPVVISDFIIKERGNSPESNNLQNEITENETKKARSNSPFREDRNCLDGDTKQYQINKLISGGDQSFALTIHISFRLSSKDFRICPDEFQILSLENKFLQEVQNVKAADCVPQDLMSYIEDVFSSSSCLNGSFLLSNNMHYDCSTRNHGIDINEAKSGFHHIKSAENSTIPELVGNCLENLMPNLSSNPPDIEAIRLYLLLPLCHLFNDSTQYLNSLIAPFGISLLKLNTKAIKIIGNFFG